MKLSKQSVELLNYMGSDITIVNAARVSFAKESKWDYGEITGGPMWWDWQEKLYDKDQKLINYLAKNQHWSPFAHTSLQFRIKAPIFVARQLVKHQVGGVWNEVSRRYVDDEPEFYFPDEWRGKPVNAKQGSSGVVDVDFFGNYCDLPVFPKEFCSIALDIYTDAIKQGVAPEQARMLLPQNTFTEWWWTGSLMFFARVCKQRLDPHAQQETREIAQMINDNIPKEFQHSWQALMA